MAEGASTERRRNKGRRKEDRPSFRIIWRENWYRDLMLLLLSALWLALAINLNDQSHRISNGRAFAVKAVCAIDSAVSKAGHDVILGSGSVGSERFTKNLERLGYKPLTIKQRETQAKVYSAEIANSIVNQVGSKGKNLVNKDGTINCRLLARYSRVR